MWYNPQGDEQAVLSNKRYDIEEIAQSLAETIEDRLWEKASGHYLGKGLERGKPNLDPARRARKQLIREQKWKAVSALDAVVRGGCVHSGRYGFEIVCLRGCGQLDTTMHRYWGCPFV